MSRHLDSIKNNFKAASFFVREQYDYALEKRDLLRVKMKEDPQIRVAVYHGLTYLACFLTPIAAATYLSVTRDGLSGPREIFLNIFGPPGNVEKVDMTEKPETAETENLYTYEP